MMDTCQTILQLCLLTLAGAHSTYSRLSYLDTMARVPVDIPEYALHTFDQTLDHFNFQSSATGTFSQRYLVTNSSWAGPGAPIFVFTGAEGGDITQLYSYAYGHAVTVAKRHAGMIVFLEMRGFGQSLPYGPVSSYLPTASHIGLLSVEQGLADYAQIIGFIRDSANAWSSPVVTFGGSLAGTMAAFMRLKYPNLVDMAWSSSSPLRGYPGLGVDQYAWRAQLTQNFEAFSPGCPDLIREGFGSLVGASPSRVHAVFKVCGVDPQPVQTVRNMAWSVLEGDGEFVYPPGKSAIPHHCRAMGNHSDGGRGLAVFRRLLWEGSGAYISTEMPSGMQCLNTTAFKLRQTTPDAKGWDYLACTEIIHPIGANNITDFFPPDSFSLEQLQQYCGSKFGKTLALRPHWLPLEMGMANLEHFTRAASRIVFVYGLRDPWHTQAISLRSLSEDLPVITIEGGGALR